MLNKRHTSVSLVVSRRKFSRMNPVFDRIAMVFAGSFYRCIPSDFQGSTRDTLVF